MAYWDRGVAEFIASKVKQQEEYSNQVRDMFDGVSGFVGRETRGGRRGLGPPDHLIKADRT